MRLPVAAALLTLVACARTTEGPTPTLTAAANPRQPDLRPARVCNAQGTPNGWRVSLTGGGFAPMPQDVLTDSPKVGMPEVTLRGPTTAGLPRERVFFVSANQLDLDVPTRDTSPAQEWAPGTYAVEVKNPGGATGQLSDSLLVVPPPTLTSVTAPGGFTQTAPTPLELVGTGFRTGEVPTVVIQGAGLPTVTLTNVAVVSETRLTASLPANTAQGTYDVVVTNPEGCAVTLPQGLIINYVRLGTLSIDPRFGWQRRNQAITLFNAPTGDQKSFSNGSPEIFLFAPLKSDPTKPVEIPLRRSAFVSGTTVTAVVPTCSGNAALPLTAEDCPNGIVPGGPYELRVKDPNGAVGIVPAANGFTVLENPPPSITSISPSAITTNGLTSANPLVVTGTHFGTNAKVQLLAQLPDGRIRACDLPPTGVASATELRAAVPTTIAQAQCVEYTATGTQVAATGGLAISANLYVVRVQNTTDPAYANYSGLIVTNPSFNPTNDPARIIPVTTKLTQKRANFPLVVATDDLGQPYLYALGGRSDTAVLSSVEMAPVTLFGDIGCAATGAAGCTFRVLERSPLGVGTAGTTAEPREGLTAVVRTVEGDTSYVFVLGGARSNGTALATVERAQVLKVADAPALLPPEPGTGGTLPAGTFYYRVSALRAADDAKNPGGETLPSDEYPVKVGAAGAGSMKLTWACTPGAAKYRIYRTVAANAVSGSELLLDEVAANACTGSPLPNETYTDNGSKTPAGDAPLPSGALGRWVSNAAWNLKLEHGNAATRLVGDTVYVTGGFCSTVDATTCPTAGTTLAAVERATFTAATAELGTFENIANLRQARQRHSLAVASAATAPNAFTPAAGNASDAWLIVVGGDTGGTPFGSPEVARVRDATGPVTPVFAVSGYNVGSLHGGWAEVVADYLFVAGATSALNFNFDSAPVCDNAVGNPCTATASFDSNLNSTALSYLNSNPRYLSGNVLFRAFVYAAGGITKSTNAPSDTVERLIY